MHANPCLVFSYVNKVYVILLQTLLYVIFYYEQLINKVYIYTPCVVSLVMEVMLMWAAEGDLSLINTNPDKFVHT